MRRIITVWLCAMMIASSSFIILDLNEEAEGKEIVQDETNYITSAPFRINSDADFLTSPKVAAGDGSIGNPWIIENFEIDGAGFGYCIYIGNTTEHFVIRNCSVYGANGVNNNPFYYDSGMIFYTVQNGTIYNNSVNSNNRYGIYIYSASNNTIANNTVSSNNDIGIYIYSGSNDNNIWNNTAHLSNYGIYLYSTSSNALYNNTVYSNNYGIYLYSTSSSTLYNNTVTSNNDGIYLYSSGYNTLCNNTIWNNTAGFKGIYLYNSNSTTICNNSISKNYNGIYIDSSRDCTISDNTIHLNTLYGIYLYSSIAITTWNNTISLNNYGIYLYQSSSGNIDSNIILNNNYGIYSYSDNGHASTWNTIKNNHIINNTNGIWLWSYMAYSNSIYHNNFVDNTLSAYSKAGIGTNDWDNAYPSGGNYWSDYVGVDDFLGVNQDIPGSDGIGDTPYTFTSAQDNYPLMESWGDIPDISSPIISLVSVTNITDTSAIIVWTTDELSDSSVSYSVNSNLLPTSTTYNSTMTTSHSVMLTGLTSSITYYFEVSSTDNFGNTATDDNGTNYYSFSTLADITPPLSSIDLIMPYWYNVPPITINSVASDPGSTVNNVTLWYRHCTDNASWGDWTHYDVDDAEPWEWGFSFPGGGGYYQFFSIANDTAGNTEVMKSTMEAECCYDDFVPVTFILDISPVQTHYNWKNLSVMVTDAYSGPFNTSIYYSFSADGATYGSYKLWTTIITPVGTWYDVNFTFTEGDGYYQFYSIGTDVAGNVQSVPGGNNTWIYYSIAEAPISWLNSGYMPDDGSIMLDAYTNDSAWDVVSVELWYRFSPKNETWSSWINLETDNSWPFQWNLTAIDGDGYYEFFSIATNIYSVEEQMKSTSEQSFKYDSTPPDLFDNTDTIPLTERFFYINILAVDALSVCDNFKAQWWIGNGNITNSTGFHNLGNGSASFHVLIDGEIGEMFHYRFGAADIHGNWNWSEEKVIEIMDGIYPIALIEFDYASVGHPTTLDASQSSDNVGIVSYEWRFVHNGTEVVLNGVSPEYIFWNAGNYEVTLRVTDEMGNWDEAKGTLSVIELPETDSDADGDGVPDEDDAFPDDPDEDTDTDGDGTGDNADVFPDNADETIDTDEDGIGNNADPDDDNDGVPDEEDPEPLNPEVTGKGGVGEYWWIILIFVIVLVVLAIVGYKIKGKKPTSTEEEIKEAEDVPEPSLENEEG